jgi:hypothetical protein
VIVIAKSDSDEAIQYTVAFWIALRSLSSGGAEPVIGRAFARPGGADPLARNDGRRLSDNLDRHVRQSLDPAATRKPTNATSCQQQQGRRRACGFVICANIRSFRFGGVTPVSHDALKRLTQS